MEVPSLDLRAWEFIARACTIRLADKAAETHRCVFQLLKNDSFVYSISLWVENIV